jgi:hypothetical protein
MSESVPFRRIPGHRPQRKTSMTIRSRRCFVLGFIAAATTAHATAATPRKPAKKALHAVPASALVAAAKSAMLSEIDYGRELCGPDRTVEAWLADVVGDTAERVTWRGGRCKLVNDLNPLDAGGEFCAGATIVPKNHPKEPAEIEVYFEQPANGKPGKPYAFRGVNYDVDGIDYKRAFADFEYGYRQKYRADTLPDPAPACD